MFMAEQIKAIDEASLRILEKAGILLEDEEMRAILASFGCVVDGRRVWLPRKFIEEQLEQVPSQFILYTRDGSQPLTIGGEERTVTNSGVAPYIYDLETRELRPSTLQDVKDTTRVLDALPRAGIICATLVEPTDVAPELTIVKSFEATLRNTTKPIVGPGLTKAAEAKSVLEMGVALRGSVAALAERPLFAPWFCPLSPLTYSGDLVAAMRICAQAGLPLAFVTNPMAGLTAPLTLAGALAQMHAELLAAIVLSQLIQPGLPVLYEGTASVVDLHKLVAVSGRPETALLKQAAVLLGKYRGLPTTGFGLSASMSKTIDVEYGYEKAASALVCALAKPSILGGIGLFGGGVCASYESLIIDHEIVGFLWHLLDGVRINEDTLAVAVVQEAMEGTHFITHRHTLAHLRTGEYWTPTLSDSLSFNEWIGLGMPGALSRAREKALDILGNYAVPPLPPKADQRLETVMREAEKALVM